MIKFKVITTMLIFSILQEQHQALKVKENLKNHRSNSPFETSENGSHKENFIEKNWFIIKAGLGANGKFVTTENKDNYFEKDVHAGNWTVFLNVHNLTVVKEKNKNVNKKNEKENFNVNTWSSEENYLETSTTDFYLNSTDFNAKDIKVNTSLNSSQSNVPGNNKISFNNLNDLGQLSFISDVRSKNITKLSDTDDTNRYEEEKVKKKENNKVEELIAKEQKDLLIHITEFGLRQMHKLFEEKEKKIYEAGVYLAKGSPGSYLAAFNQQSDELKKLSKFGYAALKASAKLKEELAGSKLRQELLNVTEDSTKDFPEISLLDTSLHDNCPLKTNPRCPTWHNLYRTLDGTCNNLRNPWWGAIFQPLKRFLPPHYSDGLETIRNSVRGGPLPSPRLVSTEIHWDKDVSSKSVTHMLMQWGQFIDHDMTSSSQSRGFNGSVPKCCDVPPNLLHPDCLPIGVPPNDRFFSKFRIQCLEFLRSAPASRIGCGLGPREQVNQVTSYIDGSMIYGNTQNEASKLRLFRNGMLKYTRMPQRLPLLPTDRSRGEFCRRSNTDFFCFLSGDFRINEQPGLMAIHIVFLRLHNRLTRQLAHLNPFWSDERLYQETRRIVGAILQHITYREFLPIVLGQEVMKIFDIEPLKEGFYKDYSEKVSGSAANAFATAAFRFGHSMVQGKFLKWDDIRKEAFANVSLHEELQDSGLLHRFGAVDNFVMGMCLQEAQKRDEYFTEELTNHLFQTQSFPAGLDLAAINIQRGRDHGLPSYNFWRNPCGLRKIRTWDDLLHVMPEETRDAFRRVYRDVDDIDLYAGGLAEFSVRGGLVGSTFACIIGQTFKNLRKGDRFWYENEGFDSSFTMNQLKAIRRITLARILCDNLDLIESIQPFAFLTVDNLRNPKIPCRSGKIPFIDLSPWEELPKGKWTQNLKPLKEKPILEMPAPLTPSHFMVEIPKPIDLENIN